MGHKHGYLRGISRVNPLTVQLGLFDPLRIRG